MTTRKQRYVDDEVIPSYQTRHKLTDLIAALQAALLRAPEEYRDIAEVKIDGGDYSASIDFCYSRTETEEEAVEREAREESYRTECEAKERAQYNRLKSKFEE